MALSLKKIIQGIRLIPVGSTTIANQGEMEVLSASGKLNFHNGTTASPMVTEAHSATLTNKTIDGDDNTIQDVALTSLKTVIGDAGKFIARDGSGIVVSTGAVPSGSVVGTTDTQTLTNKSLSDSTTAIVDVGDATKKIKFDAAGTTGTSTTITGSQTTDITLTLPDVTDTLVGKTTTDLLTNKSLSDNTTAIVDNSDNTKQIKFDAAGTTSTSTTITGSQTANRVLTLPDATDTLVGKATSDVLTNKSLSDSTTAIVDSGDNTKQIKFDAAGTTGTSTTILSSQTTNKTITLPDATDTVAVLAASQSLSNKTFSDAIIATQISTPSTPSAGLNKVYAKSDDKLYVLNSAGTETALGSGAGGINYITNPDAESNTTGWATYADAAATSPVDGTGGSPTVTLTRSTSSPLRGVGSFVITKDAANRQGEGASYAFTIDSTDQGKLLKVSFDFSTASPFAASSGAVSSDSDIEIYIYDVTNAALIALDTKVLTSLGSVSYQGIFLSSATSSSYRLIFHVATTNASAYTFKFDNVQVGPNTNSVLGAAMTDWVSYTPTGTWSSNTTYTGKWRRVGDSMECQVKAILSGAPNNTELQVDLPSGYTIDTSKLVTTVTDSDGTLGYATILKSAVATYGNLEIFYVDSNTVKPMGNSSKSLTTTTKVTNTTAEVTITFASGDEVSMHFSVPITGWSANAGSVIQLQASSEVWVYDVNGYGSTNNKIRRFSTIGKNIGSAITYTDSATNGGSFTINESGLYAITYTDSFGSGSGQAQGISVNSTQLTTGIPSINAADRRAMIYEGSVNYGYEVSCTLNLSAGDVVRAHTEGGAAGSNSGTWHFRIVKIANQPAVSTAGNINAVIKGSPSSAATDAAVIFPTVVFDSNNGYSNSTGKYTVPVSGVYAISAALNGTNSVEYRIYVNATNTLVIGWTNSGGQASGSGMVKCTAGDLIHIGASGTTGAFGGSSLSISKIG